MTVLGAFQSVGLPVRRQLNPCCLEAPSQAEMEQVASTSNSQTSIPSCSSTVALDLRCRDRRSDSLGALTSVVNALHYDSAEPLDLTVNMIQKSSKSKTSSGKKPPPLLQNNLQPDLQRKSCREEVGGFVQGHLTGSSGVMGALDLYNSVAFSDGSKNHCVQPDFVFSPQGDRSEGKEGGLKVHVPQNKPDTLGTVKKKRKGSRVRRVDVQSRTSDVVAEGGSEERLKSKSEISEISVVTTPTANNSKSSNCDGDARTEGSPEATVDQDRTDHNVYISENGRVFYQFRLLECHYGEEKNGQKQFVCDVCEVVYQRSFSLKRHYLKVHINYKYLTERDITNSGIVITDRLILDKPKTGDDDFSGGLGFQAQEIGTGGDLRQLQASKRSGGSEAILFPHLYYCYNCRLPFHMKEELKSHLVAIPQAVDNSSGCICDRCGAGFVPRQILARHQVTHGGTRLFFCRFCEKSFLSFAIRKRHERIHENASTHSCSYCGESAVTLDQFRAHLTSAHHDCHHCCKVEPSLPSPQPPTPSTDQGTSGQTPPPQPSTSQVQVAKTEEEEKASVSKEAEESVVAELGYSCSVCKKVFTSFVSMCRHYRLAHGTVRRGKHPSHNKLTADVVAQMSTATVVDTTSPLVPSTASDSASISQSSLIEERSKTPPDPETQFYDQVMLNVSDNLQNHLDGKIASDKEGVSESVKEVVPVSETPVKRFSWRKYNFPSSCFRFETHGNLTNELSQLDITTQVAMQHNMDRLAAQELQKGVKDSRQTEESLFRGLFLMKKPPEPSTTTASVPLEQDEDLKSSLSSSNQLVELSGEWIRPRTYICGVCGKNFQDSWDLEDHKVLGHPNVWCVHMEVEQLQEEGRDLPLDLYQQFCYSKDTQGAIGAAEFLVAVELRCSKCGKGCNSTGDLHRHMLECGGDYTWMFSPTKKKKWRPFGSRRRRQQGRRGMKRNIPGSPIKFHRRKIKSSEKNDSIQQLIANLPAKRATRRAIQFNEDEIKTRSQGTIHSITSVNLTRSPKSSKSSKTSIAKQSGDLLQGKKCLAIKNGLVSSKEKDAKTKVLTMAAEKLLHNSKALANKQVALNKMKAKFHGKLVVNAAKIKKSKGKPMKLDAEKSTFEENLRIMETIMNVSKGKDKSPSKKSTKNHFKCVLVNQDAPETKQGLTKIKIIKRKWDTVTAVTSSSSSSKRKKTSIAEGEEVKESSLKKGNEEQADSNNSQRGDIFICQGCGVQVENKSAYDRHEKKCKYMKKLKEKNGFKAHTLMTKVTHDCPFCERKFTYLTRLNTHMTVCGKGKLIKGKPTIMLSKVSDDAQMPKLHKEPPVIKVRMPRKSKAVFEEIPVLSPENDVSLASDQEKETDIAEEMEFEHPSQEVIKTGKKHEAPENKRKLKKSNAAGKTAKRKAAAGKKGNKGKKEQPVKEKKGEKKAVQDACKDTQRSSSEAEFKNTEEESASTASPSVPETVSSSDGVMKGQSKKKKKRPTFNAATVKKLKKPKPKKGCKKGSKEMWALSNDTCEVDSNIQQVVEEGKSLEEGKQPSNAPESETIEAISNFIRNWAGDGQEPDNCNMEETEAADSTSKEISDSAEKKEDTSQQPINESTEEEMSRQPVDGEEKVPHSTCPHCECEFSDEKNLMKHLSIGCPLAKLMSVMQENEKEEEDVNPVDDAKELSSELLGDVTDYEDIPLSQLRKRRMSEELKKKELLQSGKKKQRSGKRKGEAQAALPAEKETKSKSPRRLMRELKNLMDDYVVKKGSRIHCYESARLDKSSPAIKATDGEPQAEAAIEEKEENEISGKTLENLSAEDNVLHAPNSDVTKESNGTGKKGKAKKDRRTVTPKQKKLQVPRKSKSQDENCTQKKDEVCVESAMPESLPKVSSFADEMRELERILQETTEDSQDKRITKIDSSKSNSTYTNLLPSSDLPTQFPYQLPVYSDSSPSPSTYPTANAAQIPLNPAGFAPCVSPWSTPTGDTSWPLPPTSNLTSWPESNQTTETSLGSILGCVNQVLQDEPSGVPSVSSEEASERAELGNYFIYSPFDPQSLSELQEAMGATSDEMNMLQQLGELGGAGAYTAKDFVYDNRVDGDSSSLQPLENPELVDLDNPYAPPQKAAAKIVTEVGSKRENAGKQKPEISRPLVERITKQKVGPQIGHYEKKDFMEKMLQNKSAPLGDIRQVYEKKEMVCPVCSRRFLGLEALEQHVEKLHKTKEDKLVELKEGSAASKSSVPSAPLKRQAACFLCKELYTDAISLGQHITREHLKKGDSSEDDGSLKNKMSNALGGLLERALSSILDKRKRGSRLKGDNTMGLTFPKLNLLTKADIPKVLAKSFTRLESVGVEGDQSQVEKSLETEMVNKKKDGVWEMPYEQRPFICPLCSDRFVKISARNRHIALAHRGEKVFFQTPTSVARPGTLAKKSASGASSRVELSSSSLVSKATRKSVDSPVVNMDIFDLDSEISVTPNKDQSRDTTLTDFQGVYVEGAMCGSMQCPLCEDRFSHDSILLKHIRRSHKEWEPDMYSQDGFCHVTLMKGVSTQLPVVVEKTYLISSTQSSNFTETDSDIGSEDEGDGDFLCSECGISFHTPHQVIRHMNAEHPISGSTTGIAPSVCNSGSVSPSGEASPAPSSVSFNFRLGMEDGESTRSSLRGGEAAGEVAETPNITESFSAVSQLRAILESAKGKLELDAERNRTERELATDSTSATNSSVNNSGGNSSTRAAPTSLPKSTPTEGPEVTIRAMAEAALRELNLSTVRKRKHVEGNSSAAQKSNCTKKDGEKDGTDAGHLEIAPPPKKIVKRKRAKSVKTNVKLPTVTWDPAVFGSFDTNRNAIEAQEKSAVSAISMAHDGNKPEELPEPVNPKPSHEPATIDNVETKSAKPKSRLISGKRENCEVSPSKFPSIALAVYDFEEEDSLPPLLHTKHKEPSPEPSESVKKSTETFPEEEKNSTETKPTESDPTNNPPSKEAEAGSDASNDTGNWFLKLAEKEGKHICMKCGKMYQSSSGLWKHSKQLCPELRTDKSSPSSKNQKKRRKSTKAAADVASSDSDTPLSVLSIKRKKRRKNGKGSKQVMSESPSVAEDVRMVSRKAAKVSAKRSKKGES